MHSPNMKEHGRSGDREYLQALKQRTGLTVGAIAGRLGVSANNLKLMLRGDRDMPYSIQHCIECLAEQE